MPGRLHATSKDTHPSPSQMLSTILVKSKKASLGGVFDAASEHDLKQWSLLFHLEKLKLSFFVVVLGSSLVSSAT